MSDTSVVQAPVQEMSQTVRIKNRRKRYLETHPEYFGPHLELAGLVAPASI